MPHEFTLRRMVEFAETDMAGIMHFSNYFRYMEATEHAFFRSIGGTVHRAGDDGAMHGWARVHAACDYAAPLHYLDQVDVQLLVREKRERSIRYDFVFRKVAAGDGVGGGDAARPVAHGTVIAACVERAAGGAMRAVPMPAGIAERVEVAPAELLAAAARIRPQGA